MSLETQKQRVHEEVGYFHYSRLPGTEAKSITAVDTAVCSIAREQVEETAACGLWPLAGLSGHQVAGTQHFIHSQSAERRGVALWAR
jgi:hypothetical protein